MKISKLIEESYLLNRVFVSDDLVKALDNLSAHTDVEFKDYKFKTGTDVNGFVIPSKWSVDDAKILKDGKVVYDGMQHVLCVIANSASFEGKVSKEELVKHLHTAPKQPKAIPFHFRQMYRPWQEDWGFCMPQELFDSLEDGEYEVVLKTKSEPGEMVMREFTLPGKSKETVLFVAHIDHPGLSNDDLSGCSVGIALLEELKKLKDRKYTYKLLLTQEIIGSVFYLNAIKQAKKDLKYSLFIEMFGNSTDLALQKSFSGETEIDKACELVLQGIVKEPVIKPFREHVGNDEIAFEAPGFEIPMPSISRWPYPEYHTNLENMDLIDEDKLQEALKYLLDVVNVLEKNAIVKRKFEGLVGLANPKYDLYMGPGQILSTSEKGDKLKCLFQYKMPRYLEGDKTVLDIALEFGLDFNWTHDYFCKMAEKDLVELL
jgi:aminopeptidase-like protein|tara:strand:+ start:2153 stop:3445 length:1293 start_codon:yes stop_codon:yes gene_type:complete